MIELLWNSPLSQQNTAKYIDALQLDEGATVLDVGCGCGEFLIRLHERYRAQGVGIDSSGPHVAEGKRRAHGRVKDDAVQFVEADAQNCTSQAKRYDLVSCMGATHAFGLGRNAFDNAIKEMHRLTKPGGLLLVADGYMKQPACKEYRALLGNDCMPDDMTHQVNVRSGTALGLIALGAWTSTVDEWDDFEWAYQRIVEQKARENPADEATVKRRDARREWMDAYMKWGRDTLGYGVYLFRAPSPQ